jgi:hypothetical protein
MPLLIVMVNTSGMASASSLVSLGILPLPKTTEFTVGQFVRVKALQITLFRWIKCWG